ncbi:MAG: hypothetical protein ACRERE_03315 [Candidatus Entotheonellia bacterium]
MQNSAISKGMLEDVRLPTVGPHERPVSRRGKSDSLLAQTARRLRRSKTALFGLAIVVLLLVVAIFADVWLPTARSATLPGKRFSRPRVSMCWGPTSSAATCSVGLSMAAGFRWP